MADYYSLLGIEKGASTDEIKKAYRKKAMEYHPDRHGGDKAMEQKFKEVGEAYAVLSDPGKKQNYDTYGSAEGFGGAGVGGFEVNLNDIFESVFGGGGGGFGGFGGGFGGGSRGQRTPVGDDLQVRVEVSFEEAFSGVKKDIELKRYSSCETCGGSGSEPGHTPETCAACGGRGHVVKEAQSMFGVIQQTVRCAECAGTGEKIAHPCKECKGEKVVIQADTEMVDIPAGINDGMSMKIPNKGHMAPGGLAGNLYVECQVEQSFGGLQREENDIRYIVDISPARAVLGEKKYTLDLPIYGKKTLKIEEGVQSGTVITFPKEGFVDVRSGRRGDLLIEVRVVTPKKVSKEERKLYEALVDLSE